MQRRAVSKVEETTKEALKIVKVEKMKEKDHIDKFLVNYPGKMIRKQAVSIDLSDVE